MDKHPAELHMVLQTAVEEGSFTATPSSGQLVGNISDGCLLSLPAVQVNFQDCQDSVSYAAASQESDASRRDRVLGAQLAEQHRYARHVHIFRYLGDVDLLTS